MPWKGVLNTLAFSPEFVLYPLSVSFKKNEEKISQEWFSVTYIVYTTHSLREQLHRGLDCGKRTLIRCFLEFMLLLKVRLVGGGRISSCFSSFARTLCLKTTVWTLTCVPVFSGMLSDLLLATQLGLAACFVPNIAAANLELVQTEQDTEVRTSKWCKYS